MRKFFITLFDWLTETGLSIALAVMFGAFTYQVIQNVYQQEPHDAPIAALPIGMIGLLLITRAPMFAALVMDSIKNDQN